MFDMKEMTKLMDVTMVTHWLSEHFGEHWAELAPNGRAYIIADTLTTSCETHGRHMQSAIEALDAKIGGGENLEKYAKDLSFMTAAGSAFDMLMGVIEEVNRGPIEPITPEPAFSRN